MRSEVKKERPTGQRDPSLENKNSENQSEKPARNFDEVDSSTNAANNATAESRDDGALSESDDDKKSGVFSYNFMHNYYFNL